jgi:hypothetical protein
MARSLDSYSSRFRVRKPWPYPPSDLTSLALAAYATIIKEGQWPVHSIRTQGPSPA